MPDPVEARVAAHCARHGLLPAGEPVLAMVSGGADSTCLMHLLARIHDGPVGVLAIDHGLRRGASAEVDGVVAAAGALGLRAHREALAMEPGPGVQERARDLRLAAARRVAEREGYARIATGHTASDQAETVLFRLARGTGRTGALGMAPERDGVIRPLLVLDAAQTRAWCAARGIAVVSDPSNDDAAQARARVRGGLVPALAAIHPGAERHVAALAEVLRDEADVLAPMVSAAWSRAHAGEGLRPEALRAEPPALARLLIRRLIAEAGLPGDALGAEPVARTLALLDGLGAVALPGGGRAAIEGGLLVVSARPPAPPAEAALEVPGRVAFGRLSVSARAGEAAPPRPDRVAVVCGEPLTVRPARPGDRLAIRGGGRVAVGRLLAGAGVPPRLRPQVPVVATADRVVWVAGHRAADDLIATGPGPALVLELESA